MIELFYAGGILFMSVLTAFLISLFIAVYKFPAHINALGKLALATGVLGQLIGLFQMFQSLEAMGEAVAPSLLAGGLKVSMITTLYGVLIYVISQLLLLVLTFKKK